MAWRTVADERGQKVKVEWIGKRFGEFRVYNFEVANAHTYFVGKTGVLVHNACSMDDAIEQATNHVGNNGVMETTGKGTNYQFRSTRVNAQGQVEVKIGRLDVNPADPHVQKSGPHLNLQTQINGKTKSNLHIDIDPTTIRRGDHP